MVRERILKWKHEEDHYYSSEEREREREREKKIVILSGIAQLTNGLLPTIVYYFSSY